MSRLLDAYKIDKTALSVAVLGEEDEGAYWERQTPHERLRALEFMRQVCYGYDPAAARLQRLLEVTELGRG
jgi:hypothetical protein